MNRKLNGKPGLFRSSILNALRNYLLAFLALAVLGGAVLVWKQHLELITLRTALQEKDRNAQKRQDALEAALATLRANSHVKVAANNEAAGNSRQAPQSSTDAQRLSDRHSTMRTLMNDPKFAELAVEQQAALLDPSYAPLYKQLALSPAQLAAFKNFLVEKQVSARDVLTAASEQGLDPNTKAGRDAIRQLLAQSNADIDSQIQATLGAADYAQYKSYEGTLPEHNTVNQFQQSLSYTNTPLNDSQAQQLVQILAASVKGTYNPTDLRALQLGDYGTQVTVHSNVTDAEIAQAASFLSPAQVAALKQYQQKQQAQIEMVRQIHSAQQGIASTSAGAAATVH